jgi:hypothetical protein
LSLGLAGPLAGQPVPLPEKSHDAPGKPVEFRGEAKVSVHTYKMQQGSTYRITAKADGFVPQVRIQGQSDGLIGAPASLPLPNGPGPLPPPANPGRGTAQLFFTPTATREYRIQVGCAPSPELAKGPVHYSLTVERAIFRPDLAAVNQQLEVSEQSRKLEQGKVYRVTVTGRGFAPEVQVVDGTRPVAFWLDGHWFGFGPDSECVTTLTYAPDRTGDYRIVVGVGSVVEKRRAPLTFTTEVAELKTHLAVKDRLTNRDAPYPRRGGPHKVHPVKLEAGKKYQIDMMTQAFDAYLFLEDAAGSVIAEDDDSGEGLNARIIFRPAKTDTYRVVATTFDHTVPQFGLGPYTLTVVENPHAQPRSGGPAAPKTAVPGFPK